MNIYEKDNSVIIENMPDFLPSHTFLCGQCFRWEETENESFVGVANGKAVEVFFKENNIVIKNTNLNDYENIWKNYFDIENDYSLIKQNLSNDLTLKKAVEYGWGIRILNQDVFECIISFIISTQNSIPRIKKIVAMLSKMYGEKIIYNEKEYYTFPKPEVLSKLSIKDLEPLKAGYRAEYILDASRKIALGEIDIYSLHKMSTSNARKELLKIKGIGPKVADCVLLFSLKKYDAFPVDVWIGRVMKKFYVGEGATMREISKYSTDNFGKLGGFAQQYLFYYARENKLID